ncbi:MAG: AAA-like domain-containing protein [Acidobacteria bacterium]|nr:AAA-like domain-containing protein [Acidobacteriota bacterium]
MSVAEARFYVIGGTLRRDAPSYVVRQADEELHAGLTKGNFCYVLTARQMGKSSLMVRTAARLREEGVGVAMLDLTATGQNLDAEHWYYGLLSQIGQQLELEDEIRDFWLRHRLLGPLQRWMGTIREVLLPHYPGRVVIFVDEIDVVRSLPFSTDEFFAAIREFYNRRTEDADLERLSFCLIGVAAPSDLIRDTRMTPFNIGQRIELNDFTEAESASLSRGLERDQKHGAALLKRIHYWTGGQPYLTQRLCQAVANTNPQSAFLFRHLADRNPQHIDNLCEELYFSPRAQERDDNLLFVRERMLRSEVDLASLLHLYEGVQRHKSIRDDETNPLVNVLRLSGITRVERGYLRERNRIYARVFDREWVKTNMPDAELRRQRAAFRRGLLRATAVAAVIIATMALLVLFVIRERNVAEQARAEAFSRELSANALVQLPLDPELSLLLSIEALRIAPPTQAEDVLRQSLPESHVQAVMRGHTDGVAGAAFSGDGKWIITNSFDHTARVWEARTGKVVAELRGHTGPVSLTAFSPNGQMVATASYDRTARLWETRTGRPLAVLEGHTREVHQAVFSSDGKVVLTVSSDGTARLWEAQTGRNVLIMRGHTEEIINSAFSPDSRVIVTPSADRTARVWDAGTGKLLAVLRGHSGPVFRVAFSPDGQSFVTTSEDGTARVWQTRTWSMLTVLRGHTGTVLEAAFSPDGRLIATAGLDGTARIWEARTGRGLKELRGHTSKVVGVSFSPDGNLLLTVSWDGTARIWEVSTGQTWKELRGHTNGRGLAGRGAFSPDGKWVVTCVGREARVWAVNRSDVATELRGHTDRLLGASFSPDGKLIATTSYDRTARLWEAKSGRILKELRGHRDNVRSAEFSPDGKLIATSSYDKTARVWETSTGRSIAELGGHTRRVWGAAWSPDGQSVVTACFDGVARIWEAHTWRLLNELRGHTDEVWSARFSSDGKFVVTGSKDGTARVWEASTGRSIVVFRGHASYVLSADYSPNGRWVVTGSYDNTARVWEVNTGKSVHELRGHKSVVTSVAFSPDGQFVVTGSIDGTARVWETSTGRSVARIRGHADEVWGAAFSPDGKYVVTASYDKTARIYACEVCRPINEVLALARTRVTRQLTPEEREKYLHELPGQ